MLFCSLLYCCWTKVNNKIKIPILLVPLAFNIYAIALMASELNSKDAKLEEFAK